MAASRAGIARGLAIALAAFWLQAQGVAAAADLSGRVVGIADGDTLTLLTPEKRQVRVRLAGIDTPERAQPYGSRARQELSDLAFGKEADVAVQDNDRYGRTVGRVRTGGLDVNAEMVRRGAAWVYRQYNRDPSLPALETEARAAGRGLWALPEAQRVPPWEWRRAGAAGRDKVRQQERVEAETEAEQLVTPVARRRSSSRGGAGGYAAGGSTGGFACGGKRTCGQMSSCAEARFHLQQCGLSRLDRDRDGVPCERLCR